MPPHPAIQRAYALLTGEDDGRVCRDIPESACDDQPRSFVTHIASLALTKTGDGLADPKLVLSWLLTALGAPAGLIGLLVPVREAGALLPQLVTAGWVRSRPIRKWVWVGGSVVQGLAVLAMAVAAGAVGLIEPSGGLNAFVLPALLFVLMIAYQGVRLGRSTHLVDMADEDTRAVYTALSNTTIGLVLIAGSGFGLLAALTSPAVVLGGIQRAVHPRGDQRDAVG